MWENAAAQRSLIKMCCEEETALAWPAGTRDTRMRGYEDATPVFHSACCQYKTLCVSPVKCGFVVRTE